MKQIFREFSGILLRYLLLLALSFGSLYAVYLAFTPLTVYPVFFILDLLFGAALKGSIVYAASVPIEMIRACIAGSAYYLILVFNLSTPGIKTWQRSRMIFFAFLIFLAVNIFRIVLLASMYISGSAFFGITHKLFWYFGSIVLVIMIWFFQVKIYRIKEIPFYSDIKFLYKHSVFGAKRRRR
jgi:exosortase/archaeosortase family protein